MFDYAPFDAVLKNYKFVRREMALLQAGVFGDGSPLRNDLQ